jgi:hypothetical protein
MVDRPSQSSHNATTPQLTPRSRLRSPMRGSLCSVELLVARGQALGPRCARLLLAAHGYSQLLDAARIARCHVGRPHYARLLASIGWAKHIALVSRGRASFARLLMAAHGFPWLLKAARGFSKLLAGSRRPGPKSLGRMSASPMPSSALHGHVLGRDLVRAASRIDLPGLVCAPRRRQQTQARVVGDVEMPHETKLRRCDEAPTARRWHLGASASPRWRDARRAHVFVCCCCFLNGRIFI